MYEIKDSPGKGKGKGLFATRLIKQGERIIAENFLISAPMRDTPNPAELYAAYIKLGKEDSQSAKTYLSLSHKVTDKDVKEVQKFCPKLKDDAVQEAAQVWAIFINNADATTDEKIVGVAYLTSMINHSCIPNVAMAWNSES